MKMKERLKWWKPRLETRKQRREMEEKERYLQHLNLVVREAEALDKGTLIDELTDIELKKLELLSDEKDIALLTPKKGMEAAHAKQYARWRTAMQIQEIVMDQIMWELEQEVKRILG